MYQILKKTQFSEKVFEVRVAAPRMAKKAHAGQFLMVRANETGERVPFTFATGTPTRAGSSSSLWSWAKPPLPLADERGRLPAGRHRSARLPHHG